MPFADTQTTRLHYRLDGPESGPVLILSGSLGTDLAMWDDQFDALSYPWRLLRYDMRGHGQSAVPPGPYTIEMLGRDVLALMDALKIETAAFCGLSIGGMIGQWLGANAGDRIERLILCSTAAHLPPPAAWNGRIETVRAQGMRAVAEAVLARWFTPGFAESAPEVVERIRAMLLATPVEGYAACCAAVRDMDMRESLKDIALPSLLVAGDADPATPPEMSRFVADRIAGARMVELPAAHLCNIEAVEDFNREVRGFLAIAGT